MRISTTTTRRKAVVLTGGFLGLATPFATAGNSASRSEAPSEFPKQDYGSVRAVVFHAHADYERVKDLVTSRLALAKASWDWGFGDWESALGAASHMGRQDIAQLLIDHGASPNLFTHATMGHLDIVRAAVEATPGVQRIRGPHGITLLRHAIMTTRQKSSSPEAVKRAQDVVEYLKALGDADTAEPSLDMTEEQKNLYVGDYRYGSGTDEVLHVTIKRSGELSIGREGEVARFLRRVEENGFTPAGAPSVRIRFQISDGRATTLTVHDPEPITTARRI